MELTILDLRSKGNLTPSKNPPYKGITPNCAKLYAKEIITSPNLCLICTLHTK